MRAWVAALLALAWLAGCSAVGVRTATEPGFTVVGRLGKVEVRQYGVRVAAETIAVGDEDGARSIGFRRLADYLAGANRTGTRIASAAPVAQEPAALVAAPFQQLREGEGRWRIRLFLPPGLALASLPAPNDPSVRLVEVPPQTMAVLRFAGPTDPVAVTARTGELVTALEGSAWRPAGEPVAWFYDPPWTLPPLRRNEVAIPVSPD